LKIQFVFFQKEKLLGTFEGKHLDKQDETGKDLDSDSVCCYRDCDHHNSRVAFNYVHRQQRLL